MSSVAACERDLIAAQEALGQATELNRTITAENKKLTREIIESRERNKTFDEVQRSALEAKEKERQLKVECQKQLEECQKSKEELLRLNADLKIEKQDRTELTANAQKAIAEARKRVEEAKKEKETAVAELAQARYAQQIAEKEAKTESTRAKTVEKELDDAQRIINEDREALDKKEEQINNLRAQLLSISSGGTAPPQLPSLREETLQDEKNELQRKFAEQLRVVQEAQKRLVEFDAKALTLEEELAKARDAKDYAENHAVAARTEMQAAQKDRDDALVELGKIKGIVSAKETEITSLRTQLLVASSGVAPAAQTSQEKEKKRLEGELNQLRKDSLRMEIELNATLKMADLRIADLMEELEQEKQSREQLSAILKVLQEVDAMLEEDNKKLNADAADLKRQLERQKKETEAQTKDAEIMRAGLKALRDSPVFAGAEQLTSYYEERIAAAKSDADRVLARATEVIQTLSPALIINGSGQAPQLVVPGTGPTRLNALLSASTSAVADFERRIERYRTTVERLLGSGTVTEERARHLNTLQRNLVAELGGELTLVESRGLLTWRFRFQDDRNEAEKTLRSMGFDVQSTVGSNLTLASREYTSEAFLRNSGAPDQAEGQLYEFGARQLSRPGAARPESLRKLLDYMARFYKARLERDNQGAMRMVLQSAREADAARRILDDLGVWHREIGNNQPATLITFKEPVSQVAA